MNEQQPGNSQDFEHGYTSGIEGTDRQNYEGYLSSQVNDEWIRERVEHKRDEIRQIDKQLADTTAQRRSAYDRLQDHIMQTTLAGKGVEHLEAEIKAVEDERQKLKERRQNSASEYSLFAGLIFVAAGISFVAGDLIISHEIVAYALNIRNNTEAWMFAVGLAMVSILLKPAYDRLVEEPYLSNSSPEATKRYGWFKIGLAILSVVTLVILGWFRYDAYRTDKLKEAINKSIKNIQLNATPLDPANPNPVADQKVLQRIEQQLQQSDELNLQLVNSPWALLSFVLSGVLFALAGAVCLGIGLPVLQKFWFRWLQADPRLWRLRRRRKKLDKQHQAAQQEVAKHLTQKNIMEHELDVLPSLDELRQRKQQLTNEIDQLLEDHKLARTDSRIASYNDGYEKGMAARQAMSEEEYNQFRNGYFSVSNLATKARSSSDQDRMPSDKTYANQRPVNGLRPRRQPTNGFDRDEEH
ncbi:hypothetical protein [Larkinella arboricola]|uniref:Uncharacterized protein n=1 Tax=Larkinella arboricola TaxID=643671 RepID=A0A327WTJ5_LARAB|nr:hypothetical protein [Larkinella arboricola]RAJ95952.1 hypothetical protein LX87_03702 [Larkinella arboricola]